MVHSNKTPHLTLVTSSFYILIWFCCHSGLFVDESCFKGSACVNFGECACKHLWAVCFPSYLHTKDWDHYWSELPVFRFVYFRYSTFLPHYQVSLRSPCKHSSILCMAGKPCLLEMQRTSPWQCHGAARAPFGAKQEDAARQCQQPREVPGGRGASAGGRHPALTPGTATRPLAPATQRRELIPKPFLFCAM